MRNPASKLVLAVLAAHLLISFFAGWCVKYSPTFTTIVFVLSTVTAQSCLLGLWGGLGSASLLFHLPTAFLASCLLASAFCLGMGSIDAGIYTSEALAALMSSLVVALILRRYSRIASAEQALSAKSGSKQFSIRRLFEVVTILAAVFAFSPGTVSVLNRMQWGDPDFTVEGLIRGLVGVVALWTVLSVQFEIARWIALALATIPLSLIIHFCHERDFSAFDFLFVLAITAGQTTLIVLTLLVANATGYRFIRRR